MLRERLRNALRTAMKERDRVATSVYRSALAALDNAAAVPQAVDLSATGSEHVAKAAVGPYAAEVGRRALTAEEERAIVSAEMAEHRRAADDLAGAGRPVEANRAWAQADLLQELLGD